ncbi:hypothetical protein PVAP13_6KG102435 [Panicum virgatum]|uniref:Uncharacterized protein n=1 Tax=Panicum virgatum TaxID=38727 RepID=A0A8T0RC64_PANVG|nr:hypothetical protein PVAP13_6KG102435 [Panicum virgatum]
MMTRSGPRPLRGAGVVHQRRHPAWPPRDEELADIVAVEEALRLSLSKEHVGTGGPLVPPVPGHLRLRLPRVLQLRLPIHPRLLRLLAMVFGEGSAAARARWSSSVALELRRPALRPLLPPPPVPPMAAALADACAVGRRRG